jgi:hypothetical protein
MKVLVACEESQAVTIAFRERGHEAYSCDIQDCSGGHPEWHIKGDVLEVINQGWDLMIAHPPCTYLSNAAARHLYPGGVLNFIRYAKGMEAKKFFMALYNAPVKFISIENPTPSGVYNLPKYNQAIEPFEFGHPYKKRTCLWLKGLPELKPTNILSEYKSTKGGKSEWFNKGGRDRQKNRSKTFPGIAHAMAEQWGR